jgi:short subunit dehydrogenase-like uncharacterized protein
MTRDLDLVLYGATGFVGKLTAEYLARAAPAGTRIALAGRSREKLEGVAADLGVDWPLVVADSGDPAALREMAERATAVATTVGPYRKYGGHVVDACAEAGTHYADLTGEVLFVRDCVERAGATAERTGARIVNSCGFDSIPSDLSALLLHEAAGELEDVTLLVRRIKGGVSGGTIDSLRSTVDEVRRDRSLLKVLGDPYALSPDRDAEPELGDERDLRGVRHSDDYGTWVGPFVMAQFNTRLVRRSNALQAWAYGRRFRYREVMAFGDGLAGRARATGAAAGLGALPAGFALPPTRFVLDRVLPEPGQGPKDDMVRNGYFKFEVHARTPGGERWLCRTEATGDPGYGATSVMLAESGLCLALDGDRLPERAGVLTPATAMGSVLAERLRAAGHTYDVTRT